jgi:hypothetical protein
MNPYGFSLIVWLTTVFTEPIYGISGRIVRTVVGSGGPNGFNSKAAGSYLFFGMLGMFLAFAYDIITNIAFGYEKGWAVLFSVVVGFPFSLVHMISNGFFFSLDCIPAAKVVLKLSGDERSDVSQE